MLLWCLQYAMLLSVACDSLYSLFWLAQSTGASVRIISPAHRPASSSACRVLKLFRASGPFTKHAEPAACSSAAFEDRKNRCMIGVGEETDGSSAGSGKLIADSIKAVSLDDGSLRFLWGEA